MKILEKLLSDSGEISSLRSVMIVTFMVVLIIWAWLCIKTQIILAIPESILTLLGLLLGTKWAQKTEENKIKKEN